MASPYQRYLKTLNSNLNPSATAQARRRQQDAVNAIAFPLADGYKLAKKQTRQDYDKNTEKWEDFEILVKHALSATEKKIATHPYVELNVGTYLKYDDVTILVSGRTLGNQEVMPTYKAYVCNHMLKLKGCPFEFPISSSNTSYSAKGKVDADLMNLIDNRNKFYIQRNKYTVRLFQSHKNYRIALGDEEVTYYYTITNMDDTSTPGMFAITLTEDEKTHLDGEYAYNEVEIDYSDLIDGSYVENTGEVVDGKPIPILTCDTYQIKDKPFAVISNVSIVKHEVSNGIDVLDLSQDQLQLGLKATTVGVHKVTVEDQYGQKTSVNIIVKGGNRWLP